MISLIDFENLNFFEANEGFIKSIYDNRYKDTIYSIKKIGSHWVVYIIDEEFGFFQTNGYYSKKILKIINVTKRMVIVIMDV